MKFASIFIRETRIRETILFLFVSFVLSGLPVKGQFYPLDSSSTCCLAHPASERLVGGICESLPPSLVLFQPATANLPKANQLPDFAPTSESAQSESAQSESAQSESAQSEDDSNSVAESRPPNQTAPGNRQFRWIHLLQLAIVAALIFWGYSLVMSGRQGFGWKTLLVMGTLFAGIMRFAGSLFNEVSANNEVGDWDDDSEPDT